MAGGMERARQLCEKKMILAAIIFVKNQAGVWPPEFNRFLRNCNNFPERGL